MNYEDTYIRRVVDKETHIFIRDIDLQYDKLLENEIAIFAPACVGANRIATFDEVGEFISWASVKGQHEPKGVENE